MVYFEAGRAFGRGLQMSMGCPKDAGLPGALRKSGHAVSRRATGDGNVLTFASNSLHFLFMPQVKAFFLFL